MDDEQIAGNLTPIEKEWFLAKSWGSWLWGVGQDLAAKGLVEVNGPYMHETDSGKAVRAILESRND